MRLPIASAAALVVAACVQGGADGPSRASGNVCVALLQEFARLHPSDPRKELAALMQERPAGGRR